MRQRHITNIALLNNRRTTNYQVNQLNQYTDIDGVVLVYDDNGNMTDDGTKTYAYDYANRIVEVRRKSDFIIIAAYKYDALGRRIQKQFTDNLLPITRNYYYDGARCIEERNEMDIVQTAYIFGNGIDEALTMETASGQRYYYHDNVRGSVYAVTDSAGNVVERYKYDAYGKVSFFDGQGNPISQSLISNHILYTGREYDSETGLYYYRARYYSAELGRFLQRDPLGYHDSMNLYEYVGSNPINMTDPMGLAATGSVNAKEWYAQKEKEKSNENKGDNSNKGTRSVRIDSPLGKRLMEQYRNYAEEQRWLQLLSTPRVEDQIHACKRPSNLTAEQIEDDRKRTEEILAQIEHDAGILITSPNRDDIFFGFVMELWAKPAAYAAAVALAPELGVLASGIGLSSAVQDIKENGPNVSNLTNAAMAIAALRGSAKGVVSERSGVKPILQNEPTLSKGSTGRTTPRSLKEKLAIEQVKYSPGGKELTSVKMTDPRWLASKGWVKMTQSVNGVQIHYVKNVKTGEVADFKFK